jgi:hypothetical protein
VETRDRWKPQASWRGDAPARSPLGPRGVKQSPLVTIIPIASLSHRELRQSSAKRTTPAKFSQDQHTLPESRPILS